MPFQQLSWHALDTMSPLQLILRFFGTSSLLATIFVFVPHGLMDEVHRWLGLGELPDLPIMSYLTRSLSAFYALTGGLLWLISFEPVRYRAVIAYFGFGMCAGGLALGVIDNLAGLPLLWRVWEGPFLFVVGVVVLRLVRTMPRA